MSPSSARSRLLFFLIPGIVWSFWCMDLFWNERWSTVTDNWFMSLTMCFGSFIAGATSEGGGAVAFPVMTLAFGIPPVVARDFSVMIQSVGMTAATVLILSFRVQVEWRAVLFAGLGGVAGIILGMTFIFPLLSPLTVKIFFTSLWLSFGVALYLINRDSDRVTESKIAQFGPKTALVLYGVGILGGLVSGITGSGLDIVTFAVLTLMYRMNERVATPTSVVLMAFNALTGFAWKGMVTGNLDPMAWQYWYACIPVVVVGAPLGAYFIHQRTRHVIVRLLYASIVVQYLAALLIVPQTPALIMTSLTTTFVGLCFFLIVSIAGHRRQRRMSEPIVA